MVMQNAAECSAWRSNVKGDETRSKRVTVNMTPGQADDLERIAKKLGVSLSWLLRHSLERTIEEANGGPMLPLSIPRGSRDAA